MSTLIGGVHDVEEEDEYFAVLATDTTAPNDAVFTDNNPPEYPSVSIVKTTVITVPKGAYAILTSLQAEVSMNRVGTQGSHQHAVRVDVETQGGPANIITALGEYRRSGIETYNGCTNLDYRVLGPVALDYQTRIGEDATVHFRLSSEKAGQLVADLDVACIRNARVGYRLLEPRSYTE